MQTRRLGKNGPELTVIGFGAWAIGGPWQYGWGKVDDNESIDAIRTAFDNGINWIDTAAVYGFGHSEEVVGTAVADFRDKIFIATKCGLINDGNGTAVNNLQPDSIRKEIEASLRRLKTDYIDLYQIHKPDPNVPIEESWEAMLRIKEEGKARFIGVSTYDVGMMERCNSVYPIQSLQPSYSMVKREAELENLPYCLQKEIGVVAYSPMQAGLLTGKFDLTKVAEDDWRRRNPFFAEPFFSKILQFVEKLKPIAAKQNKTVGHLAIAWVLKNPSITSAIVGARRKDQVLENVKAADYVMSDEEYSQINNLIAEFGL